MNDAKQVADGETPSVSDGLQSRREFLMAVKGWSAAVVAGAAAGGLAASRAEGWGNYVFGAGAGWGNGGGWLNSVGGGWSNGGWVNNAWGNWRGVYPWGNGGWGNTGGGWGNGAGGWGNGGGRWGNWR